MRNSFVALICIFSLVLSDSQFLHAADPKAGTESGESSEPIIGSWLMKNGRKVICRKSGEVDVQLYGVGKWKRIGASLKYEIMIAGGLGKYVLTVSKDLQTVDGYWQTPDRRIKDTSGTRLTENGK